MTLICYDLSGKTKHISANNLSLHDGDAKHNTIHQPNHNGQLMHQVSPRSLADKQTCKNGRCKKVIIKQLLSLIYI